MQLHAFLNNNKHTTLLRSTAATSHDVAIAPATIALLSIDGPACHLSQRGIMTICQHFATEFAYCSTNRTTEHIQPYPDMPSFSHRPITATASSVEPLAGVGLWGRPC